MPSAVSDIPFSPRKPPVLKFGSRAGNQLVAVTGIVLRSLPFHESLFGVFNPQHWLTNE
jgi:hypothetical protein